MPAKICTREQADPKYVWDLTHLFKNKGEWEEAYKGAEAKIKDVSALKGTLGESAQSLKQGFETYMDAFRQIELVYLYAFLTVSTDNGNPEYQAMRDRAGKLMVRGQTAAAFWMPEILAIPEDRLKEYTLDPLLSTYRHILEDIARNREHILDEERERMLAMLGDAAQGPDNCFTMLESVDMRFPQIKDEDGNPVELTHANFSVFRESRVQSVRKEAFEKYFGEFNKYINTFAAMYASSVKFDQYFSDVRGFKNTAEASLFQNNIPVKVLDSLIEAVHSGFPAMQRYLQMRKKVMKLETLNMYDLYCPMVEEQSFSIPYEEGKKLVKEALKPLGGEYGKLLDTAFENSWIDVYENRGKTTGAYSCGVYGVHPYVLLNYQDKLDDAFALAHELGHAMHSFKSSLAQDFANHDYSTMVAEVASTVNEVLLTKHLLSRETDKKRRAHILNKFLEGFRTTVFRQTLFAEFERKAHDMEQAGEPLTVDSLSKLFKNLNEQYYKGVSVTGLDSIEWARIPHFYRAYYVYQYATGFTSAVTIATEILKTGDPSRYHEFLSAGSSDYPLAVLKRAGVDLTTPQPVISALEVFDETISELEKLLEETA